MAVIGPRDGTPHIAENRNLTMDMLTGSEIAGARLTDWRKLAQGLHARCRSDDFAAGARFLLAVAEAGDVAGHHPIATLSPGVVDLKLSSHDAIYRDGDTEHIVEWVTQKDVDLARNISMIAAELHLEADPESVAVMELGLDVADSSRVAPVWAALLTGDPVSQGHGSPSDEVRDAGARVPNLWFGDAPEGDSAAQRVHLEVYVAPEAVESRIAAVLAAGGTVADDSSSPSLTVIADQEGNRGVLCIDASVLATD